MPPNQPSTHQLDNFKVNVKIKLAALWTAVMFCYVYGDFFSLFVPGRLQKLMDGHSGVGETTPYSLLSFAVLMTIPSLMIFLSVALKPNANRLLNLITGTLFTLIMLLILATSINKWMLFYGYLALIEVLLTILVIVHAWNWPKQNQSSILN